MISIAPRELRKGERATVVSLTFKGTRIMRYQDGDSRYPGQEVVKRILRFFGCKVAKEVDEKKFNG